LVAAGYVVRTAVDGLDAIAKLRGGLPDLIISDINMPRMSGVEFLGIVRQRFPQIPVVVVSSLAADEMPKGVCADAYLHKSGFGFEFEQLFETIRDLTSKSPLRPHLPHIDPKPVPARWDLDGHYLIGCDECSRAFRILRASNMERADKWTVCVHCGKVVRFFIADEAPPGPAVP